MENKRFTVIWTKKKTVAIIVLCGFLLLLGIYVLDKKLSQGEVYPYGTTIIDNNSEIPANFPKEFLFEPAVPLTHSKSVAYPDGTEDVTLEYFSSLSRDEIREKFGTILLMNGWTIVADQKFTESLVLAATKESKSAIITVSKHYDEQRVTLQYRY